MWYLKHIDLNCKDSLSPVAVMDAQPGLPWLTQRLKVMGPASALRNRNYKYIIDIDFQTDYRWRGSVKMIWFINVQYKSTKKPVEHSGENKEEEEARLGVHGGSVQTEMTIDTQQEQLFILIVSFIFCWQTGVLKEIRHFEPRVTWAAKNTPFLFGQTGLSSR